MSSGANPNLTTTKPSSFAGAPPTTVKGGTPMDNLCSRVEVAKKEATALLQDTSNWPQDSVVTVKELLDLISNAPKLESGPFNASPPPKGLQESFEKYTLVLEDVCARLQKTLRKYGSNREISDVIRYPFASLSKDGCVIVLRACCYDIDKALASVRHHMEEIQETQHLLKTNQNLPADDDTNKALTPQAPGTDPNVLNNSLKGAALIQQPAAGKLQPASPTVQPRPEDPPERRRERLEVARTTFETIEAVSGTIPVVGSYVGAGAKVGLAVVKMVEKMGDNEETAKELGTRAVRLSQRLGQFKQRSVERQREEFARHINELQIELHEMRDRVEELNSIGTLRKAFQSASQAEALKGYQEKIRIALEELQLLVSLNTTDLLNELYDVELIKEQRRLLDRLGDASYGARGNAINEVICLPGTRREVLERIDEWIRNTSSLECVLWVCGMAGRGKSTIASTVAYNWRYRAAHAIFHFRRGQNGLDQRLICSLARQLGSSAIPEVREAILQSIRENPDIGQERLQEQFRVLFVASAARLQRTSNPILVVVDALDECGDTKYAVDFVNLIHQNASSLSAHFKFLLTTRPEAPLLRALEPRRWQTEDLDVVATIDDDLAELLRHRLSITREDYGLEAEWPPQDAITSLVKMSQGLFQWAQTAVEYVSGGSPELRLEELLESPSLCNGLDGLYSQILSKAYETAKKRPGRGELLLDLLGILAAAPYPVSPDIFTYLSSNHFMFRNKGQQASIRLLRLEIACDVRALVHIPESPSQPMRLVHTSVRDLLIDKGRCGVVPYFIDLHQKHRELTMQCFDRMERDLRQNICRLSDLSKSNIDVQDAVEREVSNGLLYCCISWSMHLAKGDWSSDTVEVFEAVMKEFRRLSETKLLYWLEVMSLTGVTVVALTMTKQVLAWIEGVQNYLAHSDLITIWNDTNRFIATFLEPVAFGALHIYASALPFCPTNSKLWEYYSGQATNRVLYGSRDVAWSHSLWTRMVGGTVQSLVFLQKGKAIAFVAQTIAIHIWDTQTGTQLWEPLVGHDDEGTTLAVSPDGRTLASGSLDATISLWDAATGDLLCQSLCGHTHAIASLAFSFCGKKLLSTSYDHTIRVWDCGTGQSLGEPVHYAANGGTRMVFSPDAKVLASAHNDENSIKLWNTQTGTQLGEPLLGHSAWISCLAFSPDSKVLVSGSLDESIRFWDSETGASIEDSLRGSGGSVSALAFSPDGDILASGSTHGAIELWNVKARSQFGEYRAPHSSWITNLAFSPNGKMIASGSWDQTIQVWDFQTAPPISAALEDQKGPNRPSALAFSPDRKLLISGGSDGHIQLWDSKTGKPLNKLLAAHNQEIRSLAFSSDGSVLASGFHCEGLGSA